MVDGRSDGELVRAARQGDREAFGELLARHQHAVLSIAFRELGDPDAVQDAAQDTFVKAYLNLGSLQHCDAFGSWVGRIAAGTARDARRRTRREVPLEYAEAISVHAPEHPDGIAGHVQDALDTLPALTRQAVALHYLGGHSLAEVAQLLHLSPGAVRVRLCRARERLRQEMREMVAETVESTVIRLFARLSVRDDHGNVCHALRGSFGAERHQQEALHAYDSACRLLTRGLNPLWDGERQAALRRFWSWVLSDGIDQQVRTARILFPADNLPPKQKRMEIEFLTPTGSGTSDSSSGESYRDLRQHLADLSGLTLPSGHSPRTGTLRHCHRGREYAIPLTLSRAEAVLDLAGATSSPCPTEAAGDVVGQGAARMARALLAYSLAEGASELKVSLSKRDSEVAADFRVDEEWRPLLTMRAETFTQGKDPKEPGTPMIHPLWLPLRQAVAALAGIALRSEAARQTARFEFVVEGKAHALRTTFTPKLARVRAV